MAEIVTEQTDGWEATIIGERGMKTTYATFKKFHKENPEVYELFKRFAKEARDASHEVFGAWLIINRIRWETTVVTRGDPYKINNNFAAYYARLLMQEIPSYRNFFRLRTAAADCMFRQAA